MKKMLQINFKFKTSSELNQALLKAGWLPPKNLLDVKGLEWKIWLGNEAEKTYGGIYLFKDDASVESYLKGKIVAKLKNNPAISDFEAKVFDIQPEATKVTRGPVD
jgi:hypothetical protein